MGKRSTAVTYINSRTPEVGHLEKATACKQCGVGNCMCDVIIPERMAHTMSA